MELGSNWRNSGTAAGSTHSGIRVNDLVFYFHPGYTGNPTGAFRIGKMQENGFPGQIVGNQNTGFVPGSVDNGHHTLVKMTVSQDGSDYLFKFQGGLKENGDGYTYLYEYREPISNFGAGLSEVGIYSSNAFNTNVDNFSLSATFSDSLLPSDIGKSAWNAAIAADKPVHWYRFDAKAGDVVLKDYGSSPKNGTFTGYQAINPETASVFDGATAYITLDAETITGDWSAEFIVNVDKSKSNSAVVGSDRSGGGLKIIQGTGGDNSHPGFTKYGLADYRFTVEPGQDLSYPGDEWLHVVYTRDAALNTTSLYVDGELIGTSLSSIDLFLGTLGASGSGDSTPFDFFKGSIDEAVFYNVLLSGADVQTHYAAYQDQSSSAVPEPATWLMLLAGLAGLVVARRRTSRNT